jgi:6-pyruvoyl tetrahydropterin synthase/QueD family protein
MEIFKEFTIEAAHRLPNVPPGHKCGRLHGHSYRIEVHVQGPIDRAMGWVIDFADIKSAFKAVEETIDHRYLNRSGRFGKSDERESREVDLGPNASQTTDALKSYCSRDMYDRVCV